MGTRANYTQQDFSAGETSKRLRGKYAIDLYYRSSERQVNFISEIQGTVSFRNGFKYVFHTKDNLPANLAKFIYEDEKYILEFTNTTLRVHRDNVPLTDSAKTITGATQADPVVITSTSHGYSNGDEVLIESVVGMTELNDNYYIVANVTANTFELNDIDGNAIPGTGFTAYISGGTASRITEYTSPYLTADLTKIRYAQSESIAYFVNSNYAPYKLTRTAENTFTFGTFTRTADPFTGAGDFPRCVGFYESRLVYGSTENESEKLWLSKAPSAAGANRYDDFTTGTNPDDALILSLSSNDYNELYWIQGLGDILAIGGSENIFRVSGSRDDEPIEPESVKNRVIDFNGCDNISPETKDNYLLFGQSGKKSVRSLEYDFVGNGYSTVDRSFLSDNLLEENIKELAFQNGNQDILWCVKEDGKLIGLTYKAKEDVSGWHRHATVDGDSFENVLSLQRDDNYDRLYVVTKRIINGNTHRYIELQSDTVEFPDFIDFYTGYKTSDTSYFRNRMFELQKGYIHLDASYTYDGSVIGSSASASLVPAALTGTGITFTASAAVFTASDVGRELWKKSVTGAEIGRAVIKTFTSTTVVECDIKVDFDSTDSMAAGNWYLTTDTVSNLEHLEGSTVKVVADGGVAPDATVAGGSITTNRQSSVIHVGLGYSGLLQTHNLEFGGTNGSAQGKPRNIHRVTIKFLNSLNALYGTSQYNLQRVLFRTALSQTSRVPLLFSGNTTLQYSDTTSDEKYFFLVQDEPLPCSIQQLIVYGETGNDY